MGAAPERHAAEVDALRLGIECGMTLIDTAEYYAAGGAERVVADAVADVRERVVLVTKVWPRHHNRRAIVQAVEASCQRLRTDHVDAALWHWPTRSLPLAEIVAAFRDLKERGLILTWGVSNFWSGWFEAVLSEASRQGTAVGWNQMPYALSRRAAEEAVHPLAVRNGVVLMAYSPLAHGRPLGSPAAREVLARIAESRGTTPQQVALAWVVRNPMTVAIPKAVSPMHVRANAAADFVLSAEDIAAIETAFPRRDREGPIVPPYRPVFDLAWAVERRRTRGPRGAAGL
jgi:diketogulonate reductase-like aldo/keto reductase